MVKHEEHQWPDMQIIAEPHHFEFLAAQTQQTWVLLSAINPQEAR